MFSTCHRGGGSGRLLGSPIAGAVGIMTPACHRGPSFVVVAEQLCSMLQRAGGSLAGVEDGGAGGAGQEGGGPERVAYVGGCRKGGGGRDGGCVFWGWYSSQSSQPTTK